MKKVLDLIVKDQLDEAIEVLSNISSEIDTILKELILLKSRLTDLNRNYRKGIIKDEQKDLQKNRIRDALIELTFELNNQVKLIANNKPSKKEKILDQPYPGFNQFFREITAPYYLSSSKSYLHIVFGDISKIEYLNIAVGCSQDFDMYQSSRKSALGSLWNIEINGIPLLNEIDRIWPQELRPRSAGLGTSKYIKLSTNSNNLEGIIFTVTTRDRSMNRVEKGLYTNTPIEGIPIVLTKVFEKAQENSLPSLAIPLLGAGFANIARTLNNPELKFAIEKAILAISIDESLNQLIGGNKDLRRILIVIYSNQPLSNRENQLWELSIKMLTPNSERRLKIIDALIEEIKLK